MEPSAQDVLSDILRDGVDVHRCAAARALGTIPTPQVVELLCKALLDEDSDVRTDAAQALGEIGDPAAAPALMENLIGDPEADVKTAALSALIDLGHEPVVPLLRKLAVSRTPDIVWDEDEFYSDGWDSWLDLQLLAIRGLAEFGTPDAVQDILTAMGDEQGQDVSEIGVDALASMGEEGAAALEGLFAVSDPLLCRRIARAAVASDNPYLAPLVSRFLSDRQAKIREIAVLAADPADDRLAAMFADPDPAVRVAVTGHAGQNFPDRVVALIEDAQADVRAEAFRLIAARPDLFPGKELAASVQKSIAGDPGAARQAAFALVALRGPGAARGLTRAVTNAGIPLEFRLGAIEALARAGPDSVPDLLRGAGDDERRIRLASLGALVGFAADDPVWPNAAGEGLLAALRGELVLPPEEDAPPEEDGDATPEAEPDAGADPAEERESAEPLASATELPAESTLGRIMSGGSPPEPPQDGESEPVELTEQQNRLLEMSRQRRMSKRKMSLESDVAPHLDVRRFAASLLGGVPRREVTDALIAVLDAPDDELHDEALASLVQHGDASGALPEAALQPLIARLDSEKSETRVLALRALGRVPGSACEDILRRGLSDPDALVRAESVRALGNRGIADRDVENCLNDDYLGVAIAAAKSLARLRGDDAVDALIDFAFRNDGTYRRDVGRLLATHAREAGLRRLTEVLRDEAHVRQRLVIIDALAEIFARQDHPPDLKAA